MAGLVIVSVAWTRPAAPEPATWISQVAWERSGAPELAFDCLHQQMTEQQMTEHVRGGPGAYSIVLRGTTRWWSIVPRFSGRRLSSMFAGLESGAASTLPFHLGPVPCYKPRNPGRPATVIGRRTCR